MLKPLILSTVFAIPSAAIAQEELYSERSATEPEREEHCIEVDINSAGIFLLEPFNDNSFKVLYCNTLNGPTVYRHNCDSLKNLSDRYKYDYPYGLSGSDDFTHSQAEQSRAGILRQFTPALESCSALLLG